MELRDALRMLRSEAGLTQSEFASAVYVSFSTVNRWENKGMRPNRIQSKEILDYAKKRHVSTACLELLSKKLLAPRVDDKDDRERMRREDERIKLEQRNLLTAEQFRKTMDNIDMALIGQRFYGKDPTSCDVFYHNGYFTKSFGYSQKEFEEKLNDDPFFAIAPENREELMEKFRELLAHKIETQDFSFIAKALRKDGTAFYMEVKAASLTEYSYGQEVFTFCRDVTRRVEAEQKYKEEVLLRDVSMQVMFSNIHCNLTENNISRHYNLSAVIGRDYHGESLDQLVQLIADAANEGKEKADILKKINRNAMLQAFDRGDVYGNIVLYNKNARRWFRNEYLLVKNPASGSIHALIYIFDIQKQALSERMLDILFNKFFDFVGLIDVDAETVEPYFYSKGVFREQYHGKLRHYPTVCAEKLSLYGYSGMSVRESNAIELRTVRAQLEEREFYSTILHFRDYNGKPLQKKVTYTYFDGNRNTIIMAQSDLDKLAHFISNQKERYGMGNDAGAEGSDEAVKLRREDDYE